MAYIRPAAQVYQDLESPGGAQQLSPELPACIVGPLKRVIRVDLTDPLSRVQSFGNLRVGEAFVDAEISTLEDELDVFINNASSSAGQITDVDSYAVWAANPLVLNWQFQPSTVQDSTSLTIESSLIGNVTALINTPLPYLASENHIGLGDTVSVFSSSDALESSTYIVDIDLGTNTVTLNEAINAATTDTIRIYRKHDVLRVLNFETALDTDLNLTAVQIGAAHVLSPQVYGTEISNGYSIHPEVEVEVSGTDTLDIFIGYSADRADLSSQISTINDITDLENKLGDISIDNPLAYGVSLALANSGGTAIRAIALDPSLGPIAAHTKATELAQAERLYAMVPMTQNVALHGIYKAHVNAMSLPTSGNWRVVMTNVALPDENYILGRPGTSDGNDDGNIPDGLLTVQVSGTGTSRTVTLARGTNVGTATPNDAIHFVVIGGTDSEPEYTYIDGTITAASGSTITCNFATDPNIVGEQGIYVGRPATKQNQAQWVADQAKTQIDKRVWMFPGDVFVPGASGLNDLLPGYYLMCALAGFVSGTPAQQPITNIAIAGIADLVHGNFYFTEAQMNLMAEFGTLLYAQNAQGTTPFCRHGLTTDVSVLEFREVLKVKNWDYLSYYYKDIISPFIGSWNIVPETLQVIRQSVISASESLLTRRLPKIGPPLLSYSITTLEQNATSADAIDLFMNIAIVNPNNYTNVHLVI